MAGKCLLETKEEEEKEEEEEEEEEVREDNDVKEDVTVEAGEGILFTGDTGGVGGIFCVMPIFGTHSISLCSSTNASSIMMRISFRIVAHSSS